MQAGIKGMGVNASVAFFVIAALSATGGVIGP